MTRKLTEYVRSLEPTGEPTPEAFDEMWTELRRLLARELRRRGLWSASPRTLGVTGYPAWTTPETARARGAPARTRDALDELAADAYVELFVEKLATLVRYVEAGDDVDAVAVRGLRQFLHDRQRHHDRLGFNLYQWLRAALDRSLRAGRWVFLEAGPRIDNRAVLGCRRDAEPVAADVLAPRVRSWNDELFAAWLTAGGSTIAPLVDRLETLLLGLVEAGVEAFRFQDLADAFKQDFRARLAALWEGGVPTAEDDPLRQLLERDRLGDLARCVETGIGRRRDQRRVREQLRRLWLFLQALAAAAGSSALKLPSNRELARRLDIRHDRFPTLMARLRDEVARCVRELAFAGTVDPGSVNERTSGETPLSEERDLRSELRRKTAEAYRRASLPATPPDLDTPRAGVLYALAASPEPGVEWLVVLTDDEECLLVPADTVAWTGTSDVPVTETAAGDLTLRCAHGVWLDAGVLRDEAVRGDLGAAIAEPVLARRWQLRAGRVEASEIERETDVDPDYRDWSRTLDVARAAVSRALGGRLDDMPPAGEIVPFPPRRLVRRRWAVAASLAAAVTSGVLVTRLVDQRRITDLEAENAALTHQLAEPEVGIPWLLAPSSTTRSDPERLIMPPGTSSLALLFEADEGDEIEIRDQDGALLWSWTIGARETRDEVMVRWPAHLTPPGDYDVTQRRQDASDVRFTLRIEVPEP